MTSKTSITYGGALYDLAKDEGLSAQILAISARSPPCSGKTRTIAGC
ncbi:MAG: hypothetical protein V8T01_09990 [Oscillospiraceae bacterium]